jgi:hypothetical protein
MGHEAQRRAHAVFAVSLAFCLVALGTVLVRLARRDEWLTAPHTMPVVRGPDVSRDEGRLGDIHFRRVSIGKHVWIPWGERALGRIDLEAKQINVKWPYPWTRLWTLGLAPLPGSRLATVVRVSKTAIGAAIAGPDGWTLPPAQLEVGDVQQMFAVAERDGKLEVVFASLSSKPEGPPRVYVASFGSGGVSRRALPSCELCTVIGAYLDRDAEWHVLANIFFKDTRQLLDMGENAPRRVVGTLDTYVDLYSVDRLAWGALETVAPTYVLDRNGSLQRARAQTSNRVFENVDFSEHDGTLIRTSGEVEVRRLSATVSKTTLTRFAADHRACPDGMSHNCGSSSRPNRILKRANRDWSGSLRARISAMTSTTEVLWHESAARLSCSATMGVTSRWTSSFGGPIARACGNTCAHGVRCIAVGTNRGGSRSSFLCWWPRCS